MRRVVSKRTEWGNLGLVENNLVYKPALIYAAAVVLVVRAGPAGGDEADYFGNGHLNLFMAERLNNNWRAL